MSKDKGNTFTVMSVRSCAQMQEIVEGLFEKDRYIVFSWRTGETAKMTQKALIHIWFREWMSKITKKPAKDVTEDEIEAIKRKVKALYYAEHNEAFMITELADPFNPQRTVKEYTSIANWSPGECFRVMEWMQLKAAEQGVILEGKGEYKDHKHAKNG